MPELDDPKLNGLTQRQENFCLAFVQSGDAIKAFKSSYKAGGKPATINSECNKLLRKPAIKARILELREGMRERMEITVGEVVRELWDNAMKAKAAVPVKDKEGNPIGEFQANIAASNQALKMVGDHLGMFEKKPDGPSDSFVSQLSPEERRALKAALEAERDRRRAIAAAARPDDDVGVDAGRTLN